MTALAFDTLQFTKTLIKAGMPNAQAEALAEAQKEVFSETLDAQLATKADLLELKVDLQKEFASIRKEMTEMMKWVIGAMMAMTGIFAAIVKVF